MLFRSPGGVGNPEMIADLDNLEVAESIISEYSLKYLNKIVELCKEEEIELVLVTTPFTDFYVQALGNYNTFYAYMKEYAKTNAIEYCDFNLCRPELLVMEKDDFVDYHHLSGKGAVKYSTVFAEMMASYDKMERQELFYDSVQEKMDDLSPRTMGILLEKSKDEEGVYFLSTVANYDVDVEYRICTLDEQGTENELIQDFSDEKMIKVSQEGTSYKITVRNKSTGEICEEGVISL